jgi:hypothetical protein
MTEITYQNDVTGSVQKARGSDGRLNVSSRGDGRAYYNSRDKGQCYSVSFEHPLSAAGEYSLYFQNNSTDKDFVVSGVEIHSDLGARLKVWFVTGTAANGVAVTPVNMNRSSNNDASASVLNDGGGTAISGLTQDGLIDFLGLGPTSGDRLLIEDLVRLGQGDAIAIEMDEAVSGTPDIWGTLSGYFE